MDTRKPFPGISGAFLKAAEQYPDNVGFHYFRHGWKTLTYKDFLSNVLCTASYLISAGLEPGDRAAILSENRHEWCSAYLAVIMAGGIAVPIDIQLGPDEVRNLLLDAEAKMVFCSQGAEGKLSPPAMRSYPEGSGSPIVINFDAPSYGRFSGSQPLAECQFPNPDDIASLIYTSGTTGNPKGVMITHRNFCSDAEALIGAGIVSHEDNVLSVLPLHHTYAFMCTFLVPVFLGASITYPASLKGPDIMEAMRDRGVSILIGVPQLLSIIRNGIMSKILGLPKPLSFSLLRIHSAAGLLREKTDINIGRLVFGSAHKALGMKFRFFASGGARLDPLVMKDLEAFGFTVLEGYGLTETSPVVTFNPFARRKPGSVGKPLPSVEIKILDPSETGEGEIAVRGPMVMKGYYRNSIATSEVFQDGWLRTGDIGKVDEDGYLFITGRLKEVIILSSGKNIYPEDAEKIYADSPLIKELCILGIGKQGQAESLHAVIVPDLEYARKAQITNIQEALKWEINEMAGKVPSYMRITGYSVRTEPLPRTPLGKLRRFMIREALAPETAAKEKGSEAESSLSRNEVAQNVLAEVRHFVKEGQKISIDDNLELDIGLDSLSKIELVVGLEKRFSLELAEDFMVDIHTVRDLVEKIKKYAQEGYSEESPRKSGWKQILSAGPSERDLGLISLEKPDSLMLPARFGHVFFRTIFRTAFRLEAKGVENIPSDRNFILAANHTSYLDGGALILSLPFSYFMNIYSLGLSELFTGFLKSRLARIAHVIPIDAASFLNKALQISAFVLKNGRSLSVFPEGGRSYDGNLMEFKKGVGILAVEMEVPVVPVYISGAYEALPREANLPRPGKITVAFGKPLRASDIDFSQKPAGKDDYQHFADVLRDRVRELKEGGRTSMDRSGRLFPLI